MWIKMNFYFAPLEGVGGYIYRNAFHEFFGEGISKYFTPFIATTSQEKLKNRQLQDVLPEHNAGLQVVPQLLGNHPEDFIALSRQLKALGYKEINLNLGCPFGTVVAKNKGAGLLSRKEMLKEMLDGIFEAGITEISIKTRIGKDSREEFKDLLALYNHYPLKELIIHPRIQKDFYGNRPDWRVFEWAFKESKHPVCYNGDLFTMKDYQVFMEKFPQTETVMLGRGLIANPGLLEKITKGRILDQAALKQFHDRIYHDYCMVMSGERNALFKMKELWNYMRYLFPGSEKYIKKIRKAQRGTDYEAAVNSLFRDFELQADAGFTAGDC